MLSYEPVCFAGGGTHWLHKLEWSHSWGREGIQVSSRLNLIHSLIL